jgi:hypothetical protein
MSEGPARAPEFSVGAITALVLVGIVAFCGLAVLGAYAPDLRDGNNGGAHALSRSAVGFAGAALMLKAEGAPVVVSRSHPAHLEQTLLVLTPDAGAGAAALKAFPEARKTLIVLPKWWVGPDPRHKGFVRKLRPAPPGDSYKDLLKDLAKDSHTALRKGVTRPVLRGEGPFAGGTYLPLGSIDRLQTISGEGWEPALVDETGAIVLAVSKARRDVWLLADPDLLNNQGLKQLANARAGMAVLDAARGGDGGVMFDVTLNGLERGKGIGRMMLQPPWLASTLCGVAAAILMGTHAFARFGQPRRAGRAFALGARALVDNSAGLFRMARKEHELAPAYAALVTGAIGKASGGHDQSWLEELARRRGALSPTELAAEAGKAKTRDDLLAVARKLYIWKSEMTRERR